MFTTSSNPSMIIKDQSLSLEVEEWLKKNKPTVLEIGQSTQTGYTRPPMTLSAEPKKDLAEINAQIRAERKLKQKMAKDSLKAQKRAKAKPERNKAMEAAQRKEAKENARKASNAKISSLMADFNSKAGYGDLERLANISGVTVKTIRKASSLSNTLSERVKKKIEVALSGFEYGKRISQSEEEYLRMRKRQQQQFDAYDKKHGYDAEVDRKRKVLVAKQEAMFYGRPTFEAPCQVHGMTTYYIEGKARSRCYKCRPTPKTEAGKVVAQQELDRRNKNKALMNQAISEGATKFTGTCHVHGDTQYTINRNGDKHIYRCLLCNADMRKENYEKTEMSERQKRARRNREAMFKALEDNPKAKQFIGVCQHHGEGVFYIKREVRLVSGVSSACRACKLNKSVL